mmetsp:Transcript_12284/g.14828  ORF Transcript_12284/g.14828 Transcript_12284/m.14828 type:complete len:326 (+) Transcript_12284:14-991(+)
MGEWDVHQNSVPMIPLVATTAAVIWAIKKMFAPVHISKETCLAKVHELFPVKYESGAWTDPDLLENEQTDSLKGSGMYYWRVPTSIFFGLNPTTFGNSSTYNQEKKRQELRVEVYNPAESRNQKETLKADAITGIVLRGNGLFGWTSQPVDTSKFPSSLYMRKTNSESVVDKKDLNTFLVTKSKELLKEQNISSSSCFNKDHCSQLQGIINGDDNRGEIETALKTIINEDLTSKYDFHARAFGGGPWRATITYDYLIKECLPWYKRFSSKITIDEMWGGKILEYNKKTSMSLIGIEFRGDGKKHYIRVTIKDRSPSETYFQKAIN